VEFAHRVPFQWRITTSPPALSVPTAHAFFVEDAATPVRESQVAQKGLGLETRAQVLPFQCRISVLIAPLTSSSPTAQMLLAEVAATPKSWGHAVEVAVARGGQGRLIDPALSVKALGQGQSRLVADRPGRQCRLARWPCR
jgi:hypothetical protein